MSQYSGWAPKEFDDKPTLQQQQEGRRRIDAAQVAALQQGGDQPDAGHAGSGQESGQVASRDDTQTNGMQSGFVYDSNSGEVAQFKRLAFPPC